MTLQRQTGFTLLELVIAMTLMGLVLVIVYGGLRLGMRGWDTGEQRAARMDEIRLAQEFIRRQLNQSMTVFYNDERQGRIVAFTGEPQTIAWVTPLLTHLGLGGLYLVQLDVVEASTGAGLRMRWRPFRPNDADNTENNKDNDEETLLLEGVSEVQWSYFGAEDPTTQESEWRERWQNIQQRPQLVRLHLALPGANWPDLVAQLPD